MLTLLQEFNCWLTLNYPEKIKLHANANEYSVTCSLAFTSLETSSGGDGKLEPMHPDSLPETDNYRVACQQILEKDHSVFSIQWIILPPGSNHGLTSERLLQLYLDY